MSLKKAVYAKRARYVTEAGTTTKTKSAHHYERTRARWKHLARRKRRRLTERVS